MNTRISSLAYRPDIDGLRAFAVLAVVAYHAFPATLKGGFIGVDIFFVISGYLISGIILNDLEQGTFSLWNFYYRRIRRIFPSLIVILTAVLIFGWFALFPDEYRALGKHVFAGAAFISNFFLWQEAGYFDVEAKAKPLLHLWSLGIEEQFYICFPLLLWLLYCAKKYFRVTTIIIVLCILSFLDNLYCMSYPTVNFYNPLARAWELLAGAALCIFIRRTSSNGFNLKLGALLGKTIYDNDKKRGNNDRNLGLVFAILGVILLSCALWLVRDGKPYPGWQALMPVLGTMLLIAAGSSNLINKYFLANRLAVFVGLVSYPFYLWHWALISYAFIINGGLDTNTRFLRVGLIAASFILAVLTYRFVEKTIRFGTLSVHRKNLSLVVSMVMVGIAGLSVSQMDGLPERKNFKKLAEAVKQFEAPVNVDEAGISYAGIEKGMLTYCRYSDVGAAETVAIIGDSQASFAYFGIAKLGRELGYNTVLLGWIVPAGEIWSKGSLWARGKDKNINIVFDVLKKKRDIRKVFICTLGTWYFAGITNFTKHLQPYQIENYKRGAVGYEPFKKSLQSYVNILREYGKEVFIISEIPELSDNIRDYVGRPFSSSNKTDNFPLLHKIEVLQRQGTYLQLLSEIRDATVIDLIGPMCPKDTCLAFTEDGLPMYWNPRHLSYLGSEFQAERILRPYLSRGKSE